MTSTMAMPQQLITHPGNCPAYVSSGGISCAMPGNYLSHAALVKPQMTNGNLLSVQCLQQQIPAGGTGYNE